MSRLKTLIPFALLSALIFFAYSNTFHAPFHYDDSVNIIRNKNVQMESLTWESIKNSFFAGGTRGDIYHPILYRPLVMFSFALNHYFHGLNVFGYHIVNFIFHVLASVFLFLFIRKLCESRKHAQLIAFLATAFWALNPVQLTSVTYVVQRMTSMAGTFYIMAMYFYLKARTDIKIKYFILSFICAVMAILSKENAIMIFLSIAILDVMFIDRKNLKIKLMVFLWVVLAGILLIYAVQGPETFSLEKLQLGYAKRDFTLGQRLLTQPRVIVFYLMLLFFPGKALLSLTHNVPISTGLFTPIETVFSMIIIVCILALMITKIKTHPLVGFSVIFFFLNHIIEGSIFPLELVYEHRNYVPSMLLFIPLTLVLIKICEKYKRPVLFFASCGILFLTVTTYQQNEVWKTDLALWEDTVKKSPDPRSMYNLAGAYYTLKDHDKALKYWLISSNFNDVFGTNYSEDHHIIPYGRVMAMATHNAKMLTMEKEGKIRPAWKVNKRFLDKVIIKERDNG